MEWEAASPCLNHTYPGQECRSPGRHSGWDLEFRYCGAIPGWGLLLTVKRQIKGMWGWRLWWEMPVEEKLGSHGSKAILLSHAWRVEPSSHLSPPTCQRGSWTIERLAHQMPDALNYRVGLQPGAPSMCLMHLTAEKDSRQGSPLSA